MENMNVDYVKHDLSFILALLRIGFLKVSESPHTDEGVVMRAAYQLLEALLVNIDKETRSGGDCL